MRKAGKRTTSLFHSNACAPRCDVDDKMVTIEQPADTFPTTIRSLSIDHFDSWYLAKPAASINFQSAICSTDVDVRLPSAVRSGLPIKYRDYLKQQSWFRKVKMNCGNSHSWSVDVDRRITLALRRDPKLLGNL
jgi:hypothetical protein